MPTIDIADKTTLDTVKSNTDVIGATGNTGGSTTAGTVMAKLNALLTSWTSTRAGYVDNIRSYTVTDNTASKTGVLSAKLAYVISLLENSTYGLSALKTAISNSGGGIKSVQRGRTATEGNKKIDVTITSVNLAKTFIIVQGYQTYNDDAGQPSTAYNCVGRLVNSTTLRLFASSSISGDYILWEVVEFN